MLHAWALARSTSGTLGVDGASLAALDARGREAWIAGLRQKPQAKTYQPEQVLRVVAPKSGGGEWPLGIPTIRDRVAQTAAKLVLEPIFKLGFKASAYGRRPRSSAREAVQEVHRSLCAGYTEVVDAELSQYFDSIPHHGLLPYVARRVVERQLLKLITAWLNVPGKGRERCGPTHDG